MTAAILEIMFVVWCLLPRFMIHDSCSLLLFIDHRLLAYISRARSQRGNYPVTLY